MRVELEKSLLGDAMSLSDELAIEISRFWKWFDGGKELYRTENSIAANPIKEEHMYPKYEVLIELALKAIKKIEDDGENEELVLMVLEIMGIDNEDEELLDYCTDQINADTLECLIRNGIQFPFYQTRWQIAELVGRKETEGGEVFLIKLLNDSNKYVQRRALLSLSRLNAKLAEQYSFVFLKDEDYMLRFVSLRILVKMASDSLDSAIALLKNDSCQLILEEIEKIKNDAPI